jgi:hypothetical protein
MTKVVDYHPDHIIMLDIRDCDVEYIGQGSIAIMAKQWADADLYAFSYTLVNEHRPLACFAGRYIHTGIVHASIVVDATAGDHVREILVATNTIINGVLSTPGVKKIEVIAPNGHPYAARFLKVLGFYPEGTAVAAYPGFRNGTRYYIMKELAWVQQRLE